MARVGVPRDLTVALSRAFERYFERATTASKTADAEHQAVVRETIKQQGTLLIALTTAP